MISCALRKGVSNSLQIGYTLATKSKVNLGKTFATAMQRIPLNSASSHLSATCYYLKNPQSIPTNPSSVTKLDVEGFNAIKREIDDSLKNGKIPRVKQLLRIIPSSPEKDKLVLSLIPQIFDACKKEYMSDNQSIFVFDWYLNDTLEQAMLTPDKVSCVRECLEKLEPLAKQNSNFEKICSKIKKQVQSLSEQFEERIDTLLEMGEYESCVEVIEHEIPNLEQKDEELQKIALKLADCAIPHFKPRKEKGVLVASPTFYNVNYFLSQIVDNPKRKECAEKVIEKLSKNGYEERAKRNFNHFVKEAQPSSKMGSLAENIFSFFNKTKN